jgi:hypothetical protein
VSADDPTKPDLSLVATDWLVEDLQTRHDGGVSRNIGLAVRAQRRLLALVHHADTSE